MKNSSRLLLGIIVVALISVSLANGQCSIGGCGSGDSSWQESAQAFLNSDVPIVGPIKNQNFESGSFRAGDAIGAAANSTSTPDKGSSKGVNDSDYVEPDSRVDEFPGGPILKSMDSIPNSYTVVDVSNQRTKEDARIRGAINIPCGRFLEENGSLRSVPELTAILGAAGVAAEDSLLIYSDTFSSGEASFVLWMLCYLGHVNVMALDGGLENWIAASLPTEVKENKLDPTVYIPNLKTDLLVNYEYVISSTAQIVDARDFQDFGQSRIPGAVFVDPERLLENGKLKSAEDLGDAFAKLDKKKPVVVYSSDFFRSSMVWCALRLMGFDSRIYTWQDWQAHGSSEVNR